MSTSKSKPKSAAATKIVDVNKPGKSTASPTAKAVIVTNRQLLQDPMMRGDDADGSDVSVVKPPSAPPLTLPKKISIQPLSEDDKPAKSKTPPAKAEKTAPVEHTPTAETEAVTLSSTTRKVIKPLEPIELEEPITPVAKVAETNDSEDEVTTVAVKVKKTSPEPVETTPTPSDPVPTDDEPSQSKVAEPEKTEIKEPTTPTKVAQSDTSKPAAPATPKPINDVQPAQPAKPEITTSDSEKAPLNQDDPDAAETAAKAQAEHQVAVQKLVEQQTYFLPINAVEMRRTRRMVVLGLLLIVLLAVAWLDITFDAGLIPNTMHLPHTHFFH